MIYGTLYTKTWFNVGNMLHYQNLQKMQMFIMEKNL
jgi:hypothetical protein